MKLYSLEAVSNNQSPIVCSETHPANDHPVKTMTSDVEYPIEVGSSSDKPKVHTRRVAVTKALRKMKEDEERK